MTAGHIRHLMVVEDDHKVIGILSMSEIMAAWVRGPDDPVSEISAETGELPVLDEPHRYVYGLRRTAKQHLVAAKCSCQWEWVRGARGPARGPARPRRGDDRAPLGAARALPGAARRGRRRRLSKRVEARPLLLVHADGVNRDFAETS